MGKREPWVFFLILYLRSIFPGSAHAQKLVFLFGHLLYAAPVDPYVKHTSNDGFGVEVGAGIGTGRTFLAGTIG